MQYQLTEEQIMFSQSVRKFANEQLAPLADEIDEKGEFPKQAFDLLLGMGIPGLVFPEEYGGAGADLLTCCLATEEISRISGTLGCLVLYQSFPYTLFRMGASPELMAKYLPKLANGEIIHAFSITEPQAGSDVSGIKTRAVLEGNHYIINGTKCFCTHANIAGLTTIFASTDPERGSKGLSAIIVENGTPGYSIAKVESMMGLRGTSSCELVFEDCRVPKENLLGKEGDGFKFAMNTLDEARPGSAALSIGIAQGALDFAVNYAKERIQFGKPIADFQGIQFMLADMATSIEAARQLTYRAATLMGKGEKEGIKLSAMAKYYASDVAMKVTTDAVQILGGYGYTKEYPLERMMRDAKAMQIFEGTNQIQRIVVARSLLG
ncbi:MAG: acyl-CoA dehydrogenase family protein [Spirochaetota bacterium]|nr:acyl-CoA dehydrogenase family protein [Spirochaetota bacterium]